MNDRFKFRLWHKPLKQMHYNDFIVTATGYMAKIYQQDDYMMKFNQEDLEFDKQCILMQCTGLKDKNGKLIYEGDIINIWCKNLTKNQISEVKFNEKRAAFTFDYFTDYGNIVPCTMEKTEIVVIGNIYENKELLEDTECQSN